MSYNKPLVQIPAELFNWIKQYQGSQNGMIELSGCILQLNKNLVGRNEEQHPTEQKYPEQTKRFRELLEEEYQTHLAKNADYSAWNINATGIVGLVVRFWDKCARIMNLAGFDIGTGQYTGMKKNLVEDETIIDTFRDAGVYAKIARIYSEGKWGK